MPTNAQMNFTQYLADPAATDLFGQRFAEVLQYHVLSQLNGNPSNRPFVVYLHGQLGAGKSALVRACLRSLGVQGTVRSPTYTLIETYQVAHATNHTANPNDQERAYCHMDLYRLADPEELAYLDVYGSDAHGSQTQAVIWFVEWPEKGAGELLPADMECTLTYSGESREVVMIANSPTAQKIINDLTSNLAG